MPTDRPLYVSVQEEHLQVIRVDKRGFEVLYAALFNCATHPDGLDGSSTNRDPAGAEELLLGISDQDPAILRTRIHQRRLEIREAEAQGLTGSIVLAILKRDHADLVEKAEAEEAEYAAAHSANSGEPDNESSTR
jgi:hypothetical protein